MRTDTEFAAPASASGIRYADYKGSLLLINVKALETGIKTSFGEKDAVRADITVIDGASKGEVIADTLIFPNVLIGQTRSQIGKRVLGRLGQGQAKAGQQPPWKLDDPTDADIAAARAFVAAPTAPSGDQPPF